MDLVFDRGLPIGLRIDVIVWDTEDARHQIEDRDDVANYERMYYHLHRNLMSRRSPGGRWHLRPDKQGSIDWPALKRFLQVAGPRASRQLALHPELAALRSRVVSLEERDSRTAPLLQVADLFAGIAAYTANRRTVVRRLLAARGNELDLGLTEATSPSKTDRRRFRLLRHLEDRCKTLGLGASLRAEGSFVTRDPRSPINFWPYRPQHADDRAPRRSDRRAPRRGG